MTDLPELIERLRNYDPDPGKTAHEAATALERALVENERLKAELLQIAMRKTGGPFKGGQVVRERREMIAIARAALEERQP